MMILTYKRGWKIPSESAKYEILRGIHVAGLTPAVTICCNNGAMRYRSSPKSSRSARKTLTTWPIPIFPAHSTGPRGYPVPSVIAASMEAGDAVSSMRANAASFTSMQSILGMTMPIRSCTTETSFPSAEKMSRAAETASRVDGGRGCGLFHEGECRLVHEHAEYSRHDHADPVLHDGNFLSKRGKNVARGGDGLPGRWRQGMRSLP